MKVVNQFVPWPSLKRRKNGLESALLCHYWPGCDRLSVAWWKQLASDSTVNTWHANHCHENCWKISHAAKEEAKSDFLTFIDVNSQPHGSMEEVLIALQQLLFSPKFCTVQTAKRGVTNYKGRVLQSLVRDFNQAQTEKLRETTSTYYAFTWLK